MPKFNAYTNATAIQDNDIFLKDTWYATATRKVMASLLADYVGGKIADDDIREGVDLTTKYANEIQNVGSGNPWAWIKWRITNGNFTGIHVGDYIPYTFKESTYNAYIMGINTYKNSGSSSSTVVGNHIDFFGGAYAPTKGINPVLYNNGTSVSPHPWVASDGYLYLNSLSGNVPNSVSDGTNLVSKDYTSDGIYYNLPAELKNVIVPKELYLETRYTAGQILTDSAGYAWASLGNVWMPTEAEYAGYPVWGTPGFSSGGSVQYPFFRSMRNRLILGRTSFAWSITPKGGSSQNWCVCAAGYMGNSAVNWSSFRFPICFRVA